MTASMPRPEQVRFQGVACDACGGVFTEGELSEDGWCSKCAPGMQRKLAVWRHVVAILVVLPFAIWTLRIERLDFLPRAAWLMPLAAAYYLGYRIGREVVKGYTSWHRSR